MRSVFLAMLLSVIPAAQAFTTQGAPKVFTGGDGIKITVVNLKNPAKSALVFYENTDSPYEGKILLHKLEESGDNTRYVVKWDGDSKAPIHKRGNSSGLTFYFKYNKSVTLTYDKKESDGANAETLLSRYLLRKPTDKFKGALNSFDRKEESNREENKVKEAAAGMNSACGGNISVKIDWTSFNDEVLKSFEVGVACSAPLAALERLCDDSVGKETISQKIKSVTCNFGNKLEIKISSKDLKWTTAKDAPDQEDFAKVYLGDNL